MKYMSVILSSIFLMVSSVYGAPGDIWDLKTDWSDTANPHVVAATSGDTATWTYMGSGASTPALYETHFADYSPGDFPPDQPSWRNFGGPAFLGLIQAIHNGSDDLPILGWVAKSRVLGDPNNPLKFDYVIGDILGHTPWNIRWTASVAGTIKVTVSLHKIRTGAGTVGQARLFEDELDRTGTEHIIPGTLEGPPIHFSANPIMFQTAFSVIAGQNVQLSLPVNDYINVNMTVEEITGTPRNLTVAVNPAIVNTTIPPAGTTVQLEGTSVALDASALFFNCINNNQVLTFSNWTGPVNDPNSAATFVNIGTADVAVTANFIDGRQCGDACHPIDPMDFNADCHVNEIDFSQFTLNWLNCSDPACDI